MKKIISIFCFVLMMSSFTSFGQCCDSKKGVALSNGTDCTNPQQKEVIKAYYFHATRRCATCMAVEDVTSKTLSDTYGDKIPFESIDIEKDEENTLIKKYKISGQTLLLVKGDKIVDLTNDAFLNARTNPEKLSKKIKKTIDSMS